MRLFRKTFKIMMWSGLALLSFIVLVNVWIALSTASRLYDQVKKVPKKKIALVLGTSKRVASGYTNLYFDYRMKAALELYRAGKVQKVLVSGDNGTQHYDETTDMRDYLIARGIPSRNIVCDYAGFRTLDSVVRARFVFGQDDFIIVSQKFHLQRALYIASQKGINAIGYIAKDPAHRASYWKIMLREYFARVKAVLDCKVLGTEPRFTGPPETITF